MAYFSQPDYKMDLSRVNAPEPSQPRKKDPLEDIMNLLAGVAPVAGSAIGGGLGAAFGGGLPGAFIGSGIGGAAGQAVGGLLGGYGEGKAQDREEQERRRLERENERMARQAAALQLFGSLR